MLDSNSPEFFGSQMMTFFSQMLAQAPVLCQRSVKFWSILEIIMNVFDINQKR